MAAAQRVRLAPVCLTREALVKAGLVQPLGSYARPGVLPIDAIGLDEAAEEIYYDCADEHGPICDMDPRVADRLLELSRLESARAGRAVDW